MKQKRNLSDLSNFIILLIIGVLLVYIIFQLRKINESVDNLKKYISEQNNNTNEMTDESQPNECDAPEGKDEELGNIEASVTIIAFLDYECYFCKSFNISVLQGLNKEYIEKGLVRLIIRDFPLGGVKSDAFLAAMATEYARTENKFWEMVDALLKYNEKLSKNNLLKIGARIGLSPLPLKNALESYKYEEEIMRDIKDALALNLNMTPTYIINKNLFIGTTSYSNFVNIIEDELRKPFKTFKAEQVYKIIKQNIPDYVLIDVRSNKEFLKGHIEKAVNIDKDSSKFKEVLNNYNKEKKYIIYSNNEDKSLEALIEMQSMGFKNIIQLAFGLNSWKKRNLPIVE